MASFWAASAARSITATKQASGGLIFAAATSTFAATSPSQAGMSRSCTNCEHEYVKQHNDKRKAAENAKLKKRMTSVGHFSLASQTDNNPSVSSFFMTLVGEKPGFTTKDFQQLWEDRGMPERHPRFHMAISKDTPGHFEPEAKNDHVHETFFPYLYRKDIQSRIEALQTQPLNVHDKTWEVQIASSGPVGASGGAPSSVAVSPEDKDLVESILFFRGHHALGDGVSLFTAILDLCDEAEEFRETIKKELKKRFKGKSDLTIPEVMAYQLKKIFFFLVGCLQAVLYQGKLYLWTLIDANPMRQLSRWALSERTSDDDATPRRSTSFSMAAPVDEVKWVAQTLIGKKATLNDVFVSCVSVAVARQLDYHRQRLSVLDDVAEAEEGRAEANKKRRRRRRRRRELPKMHNMNIVMPVHLYGGIMLPGQSLGNRIGAMVAQVPGEGDMKSADRLEKVHNTLFALKRTPTPLLSYLLVRLTSSVSGTFLPNSWTQFLFSKANVNAVAVVSNVRGPPTPLHVKGRRVQSVHGFVPLPPGIPIGVVVSSYAGNVKLSLSAEPWAVPDGDQFLVYVLEEYQSLLEQAKRIAATS